MKARRVVVDNEFLLPVFGIHHGYSLMHTSGAATQIWAINSMIMFGVNERLRAVGFRPTWRVT